MQRRLLTGRRVLVALVVGVLFALVGIVYIVLTSGDPAKHIETRPPAARQNGPVELTDLQQVEAALGPFETIVVDKDTPAPDLKYPASLKLNPNGSTEASTAWKVPFDASTWSQTNISQLRTPTVVNGYATIGVKDQVFIVKCGQPFFLKEQPQQVYVIDAQGVHWSITATRASAMRQPLK